MFRYIYYVESAFNDMPTLIKLLTAIGLLSPVIAIGSVFEESQALDINSLYQAAARLLILCPAFISALLFLVKNKMSRPICVLGLLSVSWLPYMLKEVVGGELSLFETLPLTVLAIPIGWYLYASNDVALYFKGNASVKNHP